MTVLDYDLQVDPPISADSLESGSSAFAKQIWICLGIFAVLMVWAVFFPFSGDPDSVLHYLNARETSGQLSNALYAWTRPGYKIPLSLFAVHGIMAAHFFNACITAAVAWQTIRLAKELRIPRAPLAGLLLIWQPFVFALGSDTMTEIPMALGIVLAIRLWRNNWRYFACLVVGYLPSVRPEGFFFGLIFGAMVLMELSRNRREVRSLLDDAGRAVGQLVCLSAGLITWVLMCWCFTRDHDALLVLHYWSWPPGSYSFYATGTIFHYAIYWPIYCGLPLFVLFLAGIGPELRRSRSFPRLVLPTLTGPAIRQSMLFPWVLWLTVIGVHSILFWRGWFASCGLIRIMACSSPVTAIVCLYGWNAIGQDWLNRKSRRPAAVVFSVLATLWMLGNYCLDRTRAHFIPIQRCAVYVQQHHLLDKKPWFFAGDRIATAMLQGPNLPNDRLMSMPCDKEQIAKNLAALPIGSIGIWDNEQAPVWHQHSIEDLSSHGFTILFETHVRMFTFASLIPGHPALDMRYVVLRKDSEGM